MNHAEFTIAKCLDQFDFVRVHTLMVAMDWKWSIHIGGNGYRVPGPAEIRSRAERLLWGALRIRDTITTGGLEARYCNFRGSVRLSLRFVPVQAHQDYERCDDRALTKEEMQAQVRIADEIIAELIEEERLEEGSR